MRSKWLPAALVVSLAVNLALAGFVVGRLSVPGPVPASLDPSVGLFRVLRDLPEDRRDELRPPMRAHWRGLRDELGRMRAAQRRINETLETEPFDPEALGAALAGFRAALLDSQEQNHRLLVRLAVDMTPEERRLLRASMSRRHHHDHRRGPGGPGRREAEQR